MGNNGISSNNTQRNWPLEVAEEEQDWENIATGEYHFDEEADNFGQPSYNYPEAYSTNYDGPQPVTNTDPEDNGGGNPPQGHDAMANVPEEVIVSGPPTSTSSFYQDIKNIKDIETIKSTLVSMNPQELKASPEIVLINSYIMSILSNSYIMSTGEDPEIVSSNSNTKSKKEDTAIVFIPGQGSFSWPIESKDPDEVTFTPEDDFEKPKRIKSSQEGGMISGYSVYDTFIDQYGRRISESYSISPINDDQDITLPGYAVVGIGEARDIEIGIGIGIGIGEAEDKNFEEYFLLTPGGSNMRAEKKLLDTGNLENMSLEGFKDILTDNGFLDEQVVKFIIQEVTEKKYIKTNDSGGGRIIKNLSLDILNKIAGDDGKITIGEVNQYFKLSSTDKWSNGEAITIARGKEIPSKGKPAYPSYPIKTVHGNDPDYDTVPHYGPPP